LEEGKIAGLLSLDLTAAFDVVNHEILLQRMKKTGLPEDITKLVKTWLTGRKAFVEVGLETSDNYEITHGTVQGSVLGPILFAIFVKDIMEVESVTIFADDNYLVDGYKTIEELTIQMERKANNLFNWLTTSGLTVNPEKTELVIFNKKMMKVEIDVNNTKVQSVPVMKVLGVLFDSKLQWSAHVESAVKKQCRLAMDWRN